MSAFNRWWSSKNFRADSRLKEFASEAWHSRDDEVAELNRKLEMAEAIIAGDGALITGLKNDVAELSSKNEALSQLYGEQNCLVTELRRLNQVALEAMKLGLARIYSKKPLDVSARISINNAIEEIEGSKPLAMTNRRQKCF